MEPCSCVYGLYVLLESDMYVGTLNDVTIEVPLHFVTNDISS
jgi:sporulation protein YlmC with PRC-barrel domain